MNYITKKEVKLPERRLTSRKGDNGKLLIIGGSKKYPGAVTLAGLAAMRAGCDLVTIIAPEKVAWAVNSLSADLITIKLKGEMIKSTHEKTIMKEMEGKSCVLIGNGMGEDKSTLSLIRKIVKSCKVPMVIDADAIKAVTLDQCRNSVLTPHKKEFEILLANSKITQAEIIPHMGENVILLKGPIDCIFSKTQTAYNKTGNPGMTKGGTGDVIAGLAAGFIAQGTPLFQAAINAAFINGETADRLQKKKGYSYIASDLVEDHKRTAR